MKGGGASRGFGLNFLKIMGKSLGKNGPGPAFSCRFKIRFPKPKFWENLDKIKIV
jgi:hypothetical protein